MERKTHILVLIITMLMFGACQRTEEPRTYDLTFNNYSFEIQEGMRGMISVAAGNGRYEVSVDDPSVLDAQAQRQYRGFGEIVVTANKPGRTSVHVTDNKTGQEAELKITVFHPHLELIPGQSTTEIEGIEDESVREELATKMAEHASLLPRHKYVLVDDDNRTLYVFGPSDGYDDLLYTGTFRLYGKGENRYCVRLDYGGDAHEYTIANDYTADLFDYMFRPEWSSSRSMAIGAWTELAEILTDRFAADYPGLTSAYLHYRLRQSISVTGPIVPVDMVTN